MDNVNVEYASTLVMKAIEFGAIKLIGPDATIGRSKINAGADAAYIKELLTQLTEAKPNGPSGS